jgi:hypothetical protein
MRSAESQRGSEPTPTTRSEASGQLWGPWFHDLGPAWVFPGVSRRALLYPLIRVLPETATAAHVVMAVVPSTEARSTDKKRVGSKRVASNFGDPGVGGLTGYWGWGSGRHYNYFIHRKLTFALWLFGRGARCPECNSPGSGAANRGRFHFPGLISQSQEPECHSYSRLGFTRKTARTPLRLPLFSKSGCWYMGAAPGRGADGPPSMHRGSLWL